MSRFSTLVSALPEGGARTRIEAALVDSTISSEDELRAIVQGKTNAEVTSLLQRNLQLNEFDASALAGILVAVQGRFILFFIPFISSDYCILPFSIFYSIHCSPR